MTRGPKKHLTRLFAPKSWGLNKLEGPYAPKSRSGPHKGREAMPLVVILRNKLKYALTRREAMIICMQKMVQVDGRVRTDTKFPVGLMDVVKLERSGDLFRVLFDTKGRFVMHKIKPAEATFKLCKVTAVGSTAKAIPYLTTHDGRTIRFPDPDIKVNDTIKVNLATGKIDDYVKYDVGIAVFITNGRSTGRVGTLVHRDRRPGSYDIVNIKDAEGNTFATRLGNTFAIGKSNTSKDMLITLPKGKGIKRTIFEARDARLREASRI